MTSPETGYFLVADVLGFSAIVSNTQADQLETRITQWASLVDQSKARCGIQRCHLFSDTVFAATPSSEEGLRSLVAFARDLLGRGLEQRFMVRGGISHGTFTWGSLTYGQAVIAAHKLESSVNWIGVACEPALALAEKLWSYDHLVCYPAPMKAGLVQLQPVVAWTIPSTERLLELTAKSNAIRDEEKVGWEIAEKLDRTIQFRSYLHLLRRTESDPARFHGSLPAHFLDNAVSKLLP